jgi:hypothetical protein
VTGRVIRRPRGAAGAPQATPVLATPVLATPVLATPVLAMTVVAMTVLGAVLAGLLAGCGSRPAGQATPSAPPVRLSLATSADYPGGSWAVLVMGGSAAEHNNFWQVFVRPGQAGTWKLATPLGVASNGGIAVAAEGGAALAAAIRPSQDLSFSPLASSADNGARWAQSGLLDARLAGYADALAAAPGGGLVALTKTGGVELRAHPGAAWTRLASEHAVAAAAGPGCRPAQLTSVAYSPSGTPLVAGACARAGQAGIFRLAGGRWSRSGPVLPAALARQDVDVLQMASTGHGVAALLVAGRGTAARLLGAWSNQDATSWTLSQPYQPGPARPLSASFGHGALGVVLSGGRAVSVSGPGAAWRSLPALPGRASSVPGGGATLAGAPGGGFEALSARGSQLSVWVLSSGGSGWSRSQVINVAVPYGSSG